MKNFKAIIGLFFLLQISACKNNQTETYDILSSDIKKGKFDQISTYLMHLNINDYNSADSLDFVLKELFEKRVNDSLDILYKTNSFDKSVKKDSLWFYLKQSKVSLDEYND